MRTQGKPNLAAVQDLDDGNMSDAGAIVSAGATLMQTKTQYSGAITVQRKRNRTELLKACKEEARLCGPDFFYRWTVKDKNSPTGKAIVEGVSIDGAMILARNYGNCAVPVELAQDAPQHWILQATFVDLETGFNVTRLFRQRKNQRTFKGDEDRGLDIAFQIGQSKAQRNVVVKAMPVWLLKECFEEASAVEVEKFKDVERFRPRAIEAYKAFGVTQEQLEKKVGRNAAAWEPRDIAILNSIIRGIKEGSTTIQNEFGDEPEEQPTGEVAPEPGKVVDGEFEDGFGQTRAEKAEAMADMGPKNDAKPPSDPKATATTEPKK